jgi:hypothetical protein
MDPNRGAENRYSETRRTMEVIVEGNHVINIETGEVSVELPWTRPLLYISGPMYSEGWLPVNINNAAWAAEFAYTRGWAPIVPQIDPLLQMITRVMDRPRYMDVDLALVKASSAVLVLHFTKEVGPDGKQTGTSEELDFAELLGKPIYTLETLPWIN